MKKFTLRLLLFCLLPLPLLYGLNYVIDNGLRKSRSYFYAEWNDLFNSKINADVIVCGSSRAWVHISPKILDSMLHVNSYNLGMDGTQFMMEYDRFKIYLKHNKKPKYVIQTLDYHSFMEKYELYGYQQFLPYLNDTDVWAMTKNYKGKFGFMEQNFPLFKYNNQEVIAKEGVRSFFNKGEVSKKYKGYEGQTLGWDYAFANAGKAVPIEPFVLWYDKKSVEKFYEFLEYCKQQGIKVILVFPPIYKEFLPTFIHKEDILAIYNGAAQKYNVPLLNYLDDTLGDNKRMFYNSQHLTKPGSEILTAKVAARMKELMGQ